MRRYSHVCIAVLAIMAVSGAAHASYWFQSGVVGWAASGFNSGAKVTIQTTTPQVVQTGSLAFWTGETLSNGAFLQMGYLIENVSGEYPSFCNQSACTQNEFIHSGNAEWFYEYFPVGGGNQFYGQIGPDGSAGANGAVNTYGFYYSGGSWRFIFDNSTEGTANLGSSESGSVPPVAFAELANTTVNTQTITPVIFSNFSVYNGGSFTPIPEGFSYIGYGADSSKNLYNPYGLEEVNNRTNYFEVGSGLPRPANNTQMWSTSFALRVNSAYGNLSGNAQYIGYSKVGISAPMYVQINDTARERFLGWEGSGPGSYTGPSNASIISMNGNITETIRWQRQYLANVTANYGGVNGRGWYDNGTEAAFSLNYSNQSFSATSRVVFVGWSNGNASRTLLQKITGPLEITADWQRQYLVNATSGYGTVSGNGWYDMGATAHISINTTQVNAGPGARYVFYNWSNGDNSSSIDAVVYAPLNLNANFLLQYLVEVQGKDSYGNNINLSGVYIDHELWGDRVFLDAGRAYNITGAYYKGTEMPLSLKVVADSGTVVDLSLPVYNVTIKSQGLLGLPAPGELRLEFANKTKESIEMASSGITTLPDVPFGYVNGTESYGILSESVKANEGSQVSLVFLSLLDIGIAVAAVILIAAGYKLWRRSRNRRYGLGR